MQAEQVFYRQGARANAEILRPSTHLFLRGKCYA